MSAITIKQIKIDRSSKKLREYEVAFKKGFDKLTPEQKKLIKLPTIKDPELLKAVENSSSFTSKVKSFLGL